jgi:hypothetical protein
MATQITCHYGERWLQLQRKTPGEQHFVVCSPIERSVWRSVVFLTSEVARCRIAAGGSQRESSLYFAEEMQARVVILSRIQPQDAQAGAVVQRCTEIRCAVATSRPLRQLARSHRAAPSRRDAADVAAGVASCAVSAGDRAPERRAESSWPIGGSSRSRRLDQTRATRFRFDFAPVGEPEDSCALSLE